MFGFGEAYEGMAFWLPLIWAGLIALAVAMYVVMDGFDLGVGMLFPFAKDERARDKMMLSVAPIWDGNETWLVLGGGGLLAVFPLAYAMLMPALYLPLIVMLLALAFRGVAFEFRFKADASRRIWSWSFFGGSLVATFCQGMVLGAFVQGFAVDLEARRYVGGAFDWFSPFALLTGFALMAGYGLLGATWVGMKTEGDLKRWAFRWAKRLLLCVAAGMAVVSLWVPFLDIGAQERWFATPNIFFLAPIPLLTGLCFLALWRTLNKERDYKPFLLSIALFLLGFAGLAITRFPYVVPEDVTIWDAAAVPSSQIFILIGVAIMLPVVLGYTAYTYWIFRGKITDEMEAGYH